MSELFSLEDSAQVERMLTQVRDERAYQDRKYGTPAQRALGLGDY